MSNVKQTQERVRSNETNQRRGGLTTIYTKADGTIDPSFINGIDIGIQERYTEADKTKLVGIAPGAESNVRANWTQPDDEQDDFIKNKVSLNGTNTITESAGSYTFDKSTASTNFISTGRNVVGSHSILYIYITDTSDPNVRAAYQPMVIPNMVIASLPNVTTSTQPTSTNSVKVSYKDFRAGHTFDFYFGRNGSTLFYSTQYQFSSSLNRRLLIKYT